MKKINILILLFLIVVTANFAAIKVSAAGPGNVWAIAYDPLTLKTYSWRQGNSHEFHVGWGVGAQVVNFNPGWYTVKITKGEKEALPIFMTQIYISSKSVHNIIPLYTIKPEDIVGNYVLRFGDKTDVFQIVN